MLFYISLCNLKFYDLYYNSWCEGCKISSHDPDVGFWTAPSSSALQNVHCTHLFPYLVLMCLFIARDPSRQLAKKGHST